MNTINSFTFDYPIENDFNLFSEGPELNFNSDMELKNLEFPIFDQSFEMKDLVKSESTQSKSPR